MNIHVAKAPWWDHPIEHHIVESTQLNTMCVAYNHHFTIYSKNKMKVTELIPFTMWKVVHVTYEGDYPKSKFQEETLKERL